MNYFSALKEISIILKTSIALTAYQGLMCLGGQRPTIENYHIVVHTLHSYTCKPVESESIYLKTRYILSLPNGMVAHALTYWPNVGAFGPSDDLTYPPLWKLQYTSVHTNVTHASIVTHTT